MGAAPHKLAKAASLRRRLGLSPATSVRVACHVGSHLFEAHEVQRRFLHETFDPPFEVDDLLRESPVATSHGAQGKLRRRGRVGKLHCTLTSPQLIEGNTRVGVGVDTPMITDIPDSVTLLPQSPFLIRLMVERRWTML